MRLLITFVYFLIAYGSIFPFNFSSEEFKHSYHQLLHIQMSGIGDVLGNILLFMPLGLLYALKYSNQRLSSVKPLNNNTFGLWLGVFVFAFVLQLLQIALPERDQNILDVLFNLLGFLLGFIGLSALNVQALNVKPKLQYLPVIIGLTYILSMLSPFVPSLDFQSFKDSIKPLLVTPSFSIIFEILIQSIFWLVVIRLLSFQQKKSPIKVIITLWGAMLLAKVVIVFNALSVVDVIAPLIAIGIAMNINVNHQKVTKILLILLLIAFGVYSFSFFGSMNINAQTFIPFHSYLNGQLYSGIQALLFKLFVFSAVIWLAIELGKNAKNITIMLAVYILIIEIAQLFMPTRVTDFGDLLLVVIAYLSVRHIGDYLASTEVDTDMELTSQESPEKSPTDHKQHKALSVFKSISPTKQFWGIICIGLVGFNLMVNMILGLPGVPYNVVELFASHASVLDLCFFALFLLLLGGASGFIVQQVSSASNASVFKFIGLHLISLAGIFSCLYFSVTIESLEDLLGSSKLSQMLYQNQTSDQFLPMFINVLSLTLMAKIAQFIEFLFRFAALYGLVQIPLTITLLIFTTSTKSTSLVKYTLISLLLLPLCLYVVYYAAVTDNLVELIANPILLSLSLVALMMSIAFEWKLILAKKFVFAMAIIGGLSLASWFVAQSVFELEIVKYGYLFSAFDFLIGGSRVEKLSEFTLMTRWCVIVAVFQSVLLCGLLVYKHLPKATFSSLSIMIKPHYVYVFCVLVIVGYVGNRLFGEHLHWQTLAQHFTKESDRDFIEDTSAAKTPYMITSGVIYLNNKPTKDLATAFAQAKNYDTIRLSKGQYQQAGVLTASHVSIIAEKGAVVFGKTKQGKGALVIKGDQNYIEGLECHSIYVADNNGVCVRLEGKGITLKNVYFHHSQGGFLGSTKGGDIVIENSRFEHLGDKGFYHGIYTLAPSRLFIKNSYFLNNRNGGHEIKSRSIHTEITHSVIASSQSRDSRLIDVPNGGVLIIKDNILIEGPFSENHDLLSWGVEGITHSKGEVIIDGNTIISDKSQAKLISLKEKPEVFIVEDNLVVGNVQGINEEDNFFFKTRKALSIAPAPFIPKL